jgi:hypothetical protein
MPLHPAPTKPYANTALTEYLVNRTPIQKYQTSMCIVPPTHDWVLLADTFANLVFDHTQGQNHALVGTVPSAVAPCLQALGLDIRAKGVVKSLAEDGFHLPYGFLTWVVEDENLVPVEELTPAIPGTPYAEHHLAQTLSRPAPDFPLQEDAPPAEVHIPVGALVKGGFEVNMRPLTGPLHMSPSIKVHAHTNVRLYRPMFYNATTFSIVSEGATLIAPYLDHATLTIRGPLTMEPSEGHRDLLSVAGEKPPGTEDAYRYQRFLTGPHRPIRSRADLKEALKGDSEPVLMSPSFGDGATIEFALSKETSREFYPLYTLRQLQEMPARVLAQNLFWHRGSMFESSVRTDDDLTLDNLLIVRTKIHIPQGKTLTLRHCLVSQMKVVGGGSVVIERSPCYWLDTDGPLIMRKMNHFTPMVGCFEQGAPVTLRLSGRVAGLHKKLMEMVESCRDETPDREWVLRADYHVGRKLIKTMVETLNNDEERYRLLLSLYSDWLKEPEHGLKRRNTDTVPYFLSGMSPVQTSRVFMASEQKDPVFDYALFTHMSTNI